MEWNGTGIKTERSVPFCDPFCFRLQSVHCLFTKTNDPFHFVKREFFWCLLYVQKCGCIACVPFACSLLQATVNVAFI